MYNCVITRAAVCVLNALSIPPGARAAGFEATRNSPPAESPTAALIEFSPRTLAALQSSSRLIMDFAWRSDATFTATLERRPASGGNCASWSGRLLPPAEGSATLVVCDGVLAVALRVDGVGTFDLQYLGDGRYAVRELDGPALATCGGGLRYTTDVSDARDDERSSSGVGLRCDDGSLVDVLVVYTQAARIAAGGTAAILAQINLAVADANEAFSDSLIDVQLRLVHTAEVVYAESGSWQTDGPRLVNPSDGYIDEVHALRDQYGADCVSLWVNTLNTGGIGYYPDGSLTGIGASGFSMLRLINAPFLTFAHEIGHNHFCAHDRANFPDPPFAEYSYGYIEPGGAWHDIMSPAASALVPYFANPDLFWPGPSPPNPGPIGVPMGQPNPCNIALTINQTRHFVANFRATHIPNLPSVLFVRSDAPGGGDGRAWGTAYQALDDALCAAAGSNGAVQQIWVKAGTYRPGKGSNDRAATFRPVNGVAVYGGFAGHESSLAQRDPNANVTTLSGDIGAADSLSDNCYHVVTISGNDDTVVLDGFTIAAGNANGTSPEDGGGAVLTDGVGAACFVNCRLTGNQALRFGGAVYSRFGGSPTFEQCLISGNHVIDTTWPAGGGGVYVDGVGMPSLNDCLVQGNTAARGGGIAMLFGAGPALTRTTVQGNQSPGGEGGGLYCYSGASPTADRCIVADNTAALGAGISAWFDSAPAISNSIIRGNTASSSGGGLYLYSSAAAALTNCLIIGNAAAESAGVAALFGSSTVLSNCTVVGNIATTTAGGISTYEATPMLRNSLLWQNRAAGIIDEAAQATVYTGGLTINYSSVQGWSGGLGGTANDGLNPRFVDADGADNVFGTTDDNARLERASPGVNTGSNAAVPGGTTTDLEGRLRIVAGTVDRGAYEFALPGDYDGNGAVNVADLFELTRCLNGPGLAPPAAPPPTADACRAAFDADLDGDVDLHDTARVMIGFGQIQ